MMSFKIFACAAVASIGSVAGQLRGVSEDVHETAFVQVGMLAPSSTEETTDELLEQAKRAQKEAIAATQKSIKAVERPKRYWFWQRWWDSICDWKARRWPKPTASEIEADAMEQVEKVKATGDALARPVRDIHVDSDDEALVNDRTPSQVKRDAAELAELERMVEEQDDTGTSTDIAIETLQREIDHDHHRSLSQQLRDLENSQDR